MEEYNKLITKIKKYFELEDVTYTEEVISAFDLYQILTDKFMTLYNVIYDNNLRNKINNYLLADNVVKKIRKKIFNTQSPWVEYILSQFYKGTSKVSINIVDDSIFQRKIYHTTICKDLHNEGLYIEESRDDNPEYIREFISDIERHLCTLEEFYKLISLSNPFITQIPDYTGKGIVQTFSDGFFYISLGYDTYGQVEYRIELDKNADPLNIYTKSWLDLERLQDYVNENAIELLRKVPINVDELNETSKAIIKEYNDKRKDNNKKLQLNGNH